MHFMLDQTGVLFWGHPVVSSHGKLSARFLSDTSTVIEKVGLSSYFDFLLAQLSKIRLKLLYTSQLETVPLQIFDDPPSEVSSNLCKILDCKPLKV